MREFKRDDKFIYKWMEKEDLDIVMDFVDEVYETIENKSVYFKEKRENIDKILDDGGTIIGVYDGDTLAAIRITSIPDFENNLAFEVDNLEVPEKKVALNKAVIVKKEYRGNNLQNITRDIAVEDMKQKGQTVFMSTVSPENPYSYRNALKEGYVLVELSKIHPTEEHPEGLDRFVTLKSDKVDFQYTGEEKIVSHTNIEKIQKLIDHNYVGVEAVDEDKILFKQIKQINKNLVAEEKKKVEQEDMKKQKEIEEKIMLDHIQAITAPRCEINDLLSN